MAQGSVLEIGVGPGVNFTHYDPASVSKVYALEPNPGMLRRAEEERRRAMDGAYFDEGASGYTFLGDENLPAGFAYLYQQKDGDHYEAIGKVRSRGGAGTSFWSPELDRYYVAAPATDKEEAAILVYAPQD